MHSQAQAQYSYSLAGDSYSHGAIAGEGAGHGTQDNYLPD